MCVWCECGLCGVSACVRACVRAIVRACVRVCLMSATLVLALFAPCTDAMRSPIFSS